MEKKKVLDVIEKENKLSYDDIVNVRKDVSDVKIVRDKNTVLKTIAILVVVAAIVFGTLLLLGLM